MIAIYETAKRELAYNATRFLQMISEEGGLAAARQLLWSPKPSEGFTTLWERGRLDLTVEAHILRDEFTPSSLTKTAPRPAHDWWSTAGRKATVLRHNRDRNCQVSKP
jgi:hypothetical protein